MNLKTIEPIIKWSGSKRHLAKEIIKHISDNGNHYYEPFVGGGSIFVSLMLNEYKFEKYYLSDINQNLIDMWKCIQNGDMKLMEEYNTLYTIFNSKDIQWRKDFFKEKTIEFNYTQSPYLFFFLNRTAFNGLVRYNKKGNYNSSCHFTRPGIEPKKIEKLFNIYHQLLSKNNVEFTCQSFEKIKPTINDVIFLDPPYFNTKSMYMLDKQMDFNHYFLWLETLNGTKIMTFDGKTEDKDYSYDIPIPVKEIIYLSSKNSSYANMNQSSRKVQESLILI